MGSDVPTRKRRGVSSDPKERKSEQQHGILASDSPVLDLFVLSCTTSNDFLQVASASDLQFYQQQQQLTVYILARYPGNGNLVQSIRENCG